jgi:hypothetical protein
LNEFISLKAYIRGVLAESEALKEQDDKEERREEDENKETVCRRLVSILNVGKIRVMKDWDKKKRRIGVGCNG